ncbi:MAG: hypothetical protein IKP58_05950 [Victivallales bacterium]|nr:hypothetical protein [Victivallales bacterium]
MRREQRRKTPRQGDHIDRFGCGQRLRQVICGAIILMVWLAAPKQQCSIVEGMIFEKEYFTLVELHLHCIHSCILLFTSFSIPMP